MAEHKIETADGIQKVECLRGGDRYSEDCPLCNRAKEKEIKKWVEAHSPYCILCSEKPKCYLCLKKGCEQWLADKGFVEDYGTYRGCPRLVLNMYCEDFVCKYKFLGWWNRDWKKRFKSVKKEAAGKITERKRKELKEKFLKERKERKEKQHHVKTSKKKTKTKKQDRTIPVRPAKKKLR